jgi:pimeloyl-ACP methyl ester carboxylesterase
LPKQCESLASRNKLIQLTARRFNHMLRWFENRQVYHPRREWIASPSDLGRPCEDVHFTTADGVRLSAWFSPAAAESPRAKFAILICHGNGGNISHRLELCRALLRTGASVLVFDYRGYGRSDGKVDEEGTYQDAQSAFRWLRQRGFAERRIVVLGESLGGAVAAELALREPVGGLALYSAFTSIADVGEEFFPWLPVRRLHRIKYDTLTKLPRVNVPVLVMHSRNDRWIRYHHGEKNFAAANEPKLFRETYGEHNHSEPSDYLRCTEAMNDFLQMVEQIENR